MGNDSLFLVNDVSSSLFILVSQTQGIAICVFLCVKEHGVVWAPWDRDEKRNIFHKVVRKFVWYSSMMMIMAENSNL